ncbi:hypothetical protein ACFWHV_32245 [Streptomyces collinus]|uniref:hypothetical protein n=1 Tax=Streptomyces collinus TaxID=42684 RepID=UPI003664881D
MSARDKLLTLDGSDEWPAVVDRILAEHRAEVLAEHGNTGEKCIPGGEQPVEDGATHRHPRPCEFPEVLPCRCVRPTALPEESFLRARRRALVSSYFEGSRQGQGDRSLWVAAGDVW